MSKTKSSDGNIARSTTQAISAQAWVAGVDGCRAGWVVVLINLATGYRKATVVSRFVDVLVLPEEPKIVAIDVPIGLPSNAVQGGRVCEQEARKLLGPPRASSVFSSPSRAALQTFRGGGNYLAVSGANRRSSPNGIGLSKQTFSILQKISEVDYAMTPAQQVRVKEVHPELSFYEANARHAMADSKRSSRGRRQRARVLVNRGFLTPLRMLGKKLPVGVKSDDLLDACIACWTAERIAMSNSIM